MSVTFKEHVDELRRKNPFITPAEECDFIHPDDDSEDDYAGIAIGTDSGCLFIKEFIGCADAEERFLSIGILLEPHKVREVIAVLERRLAEIENVEASP
jgi:hypothetical protein